MRVRLSGPCGKRSPGDASLFTVVDTAEEGWDVVRAFYDLPAVKTGV